MEYDAWDEGTVDLTLEEEAAYLRICHQMYRRRGPMLNSDRLLSSLWRCHQNKARAMLKRLIEKGKILVTQDGHLTNTRVTQELDARETLSTRRVHAGHTGGIRSGEVRRNQLKDNDPSEANALAPRSREEEIREEKRRLEGDAPNGALPLGAIPARKERRQSKRAATFPEGFSLTEPNRKYAADNGFNGIEAERMFERFKNHHTAKGSTFVDWPAAWRTWVGNQVKFNEHRTTRASGGMDPRF